MDIGSCSRAADSTQPGCVNVHGFSLHAGVRCGAHQRKELERLCRYITRPAIANASLIGSGSNYLADDLNLEREVVAA